MPQFSPNSWPRRFGSNYHRSLQAFTLITSGRFTESKVGVFLDFSKWQGEQESNLQLP